MGNRLDVYVLDEDGSAVSGAKVTVDIAGIVSGGTLEEYTDDDGHAEFETADDYEDSRKLMIYVRGQSFGPYYIEGGAYTVRLD